MNINRRKFRSYSERNDRQPLIPHVQTSRSFYDTTHNSTACAQQHRRYRRNRPRSLPLVPTEATVDRSLSGSLPSTTATISEHGSYDVNNPPSVPSSPKFGGDSGYPDVLLPIPDGGHQLSYGKDKTGLKQAIDQVNSQSADIFNVDSERPDIEEQTHHDYKENITSPSGRASVPPHMWPDISMLEDWALRETRERTRSSFGTKRVNEPVYIEGRLRPQKFQWQRKTEDEPYRWTYFNEDLDSTVHSQSMSGLLDSGMTFGELFRPSKFGSNNSPANGDSRSTDEYSPSRPSQSESEQAEAKSDQSTNQQQNDSLTSFYKGQSAPPPRSSKATFWLDVLSPTEAEMRLLQRTFGIHGLSAEDIMMQEPREKVELFQHYYFVSYRSFEQDASSEEYLEPVNIYTIVFKEGVLTFHFSMTPHPANVRRRIRQLHDHIAINSDWISYAIIDDITDAYGPLIEKIEDEVDKIDEGILSMRNSDTHQQRSKKEKTSLSWFHKIFKREGLPDSKEDFDSSMINEVGRCRKRVMSLYRLLVNKADVVRGFAKRCNEKLQVAPTSEFGFYLSDIQDHIVTMTSNLNHYENLLSRAHSNYLTQISLRMNERQEETADVLGKLTVLGTIVLPMNIVTGMWGMNVQVPGQEVPNLSWFYAITAFLLLFGFSCYFVARKAFKLV